MDIETKQLPFSREQQKWFDAACAKIDAGRLKQLDMDLTNIHSPTGAEREASEFMVDYMKKIGLKAFYQSVNPLTGNAVGRIKGNGNGPALLLYAPIDTHIENDPEKDIPWVGPELRDDMKPHAYARGDTVIGLGASNPKAMVSTLTEAVNCVLEAGIPLKGDVILAFAGGGMPVVVPERHHYGLSKGVTHMMANGVTADYGIIMKPWNEVYYEHPGMCWFKVTVKGTMGYSGIPRGTPGFRSSIVPAAKVILELEAWLPEYTKRHTSDQIAPEGWIAAVRSGWPDRPAFPSAATEIYLDMRTNPQQSTGAVQAEFDACMRDIIARNPEIEAEWEMTAAVPGSRTEPDNWVVQTALRGWQETNGGKPYPGGPKLSGQTDAATICKLGLPLVRIGYPWVGDKEMPSEFSEGLGGMGVSHIPDLMACCKALIYSIIDTCTRTRKETGLPS
jgi:acetylornithine deacetylase/succinyl-diaminopimelate desuccinylase-like protein